MPTDFDTIYNQFDHAVSKMRQENRRLAGELAQRDGAIQALQRRLWDLENKHAVLQQENARLKARQRSETTYVPTVTPAPMKPPVDSPTQRTWSRPETPYPVETTPLMLPTRREMGVDAPVFGPTLGEPKGYSHWMHDTGSK